MSLSGFSNNLNFFRFLNFYQDVFFDKIMREERSLLKWYIVIAKQLISSERYQNNMKHTINC